MKSYTNTTGAHHETFKQMTQAELIARAAKWEADHRVGCTVYQTADGDAGLQWNAQQSLPSNTTWFHVHGPQDIFSE